MAPSADLRTRILACLAAGSAEASDLAKRLGATRECVLRELEVMAVVGGLVDFHEPPAPCGWETARWFLVPYAFARPTPPEPR